MMVEIAEPMIQISEPLKFKNGEFANSLNKDCPANSLAEKEGRISPGSILKFKNIFPNLEIKPRPAQLKTVKGNLSELTYHTAQCKAKYNLMEADQLFKQELLQMSASRPGIINEMKKFTTAKRIQNGETRAMWRGADPLNQEYISTLQRELNDTFKEIDKLAQGLGKEGNLFGYSMASTALAAFCSLKKDDSEFYVGRKLMDTMVPPIEIKLDLIQRAAKKRLLRKTDIPVYEVYSKELGYDHNVGDCGTTYVAWAGWYVMNSSATSLMNVERAKLIATIETIGMTNWACMDDVFKHPHFAPFARDTVNALAGEDWRSDPACNAAFWGGFYSDMKRRAMEREEWPANGIYEEWTYDSAQPTENVGVASAEILYESGADSDLMFAYHVAFRRYDDLLDVTTDSVSNESNNQLYARLKPHFEKETSREKLARVCMDYHEELLRISKRISKQADETNLKFQAKLMSRNITLWYIWTSRYNIFYKYLLGMKSGMVPVEQAQPAIRWDLVDTAYMAKVFKNAGCDCSGGKYAVLVNSLTSLVKNMNREKYVAGFTELYTAFVASIVGITLCHNSTCNCGERLAEYIDAEMGGEICGFVLKTLHSAEADKLEYHTFLWELYDSEHFSVFRYAAAGVGYYFQELTQADIGSLMIHCSTELNTL